MWQNRVERKIRDTGQQRRGEERRGDKWMLNSSVSAWRDPARVWSEPPTDLVPEDTDIGKTKCFGCLHMGAHSLSHAHTHTHTHTHTKDLYCLDESSATMSRKSDLIWVRWSCLTWIQKGRWNLKNDLRHNDIRIGKKEENGRKRERGNTLCGAELTSWDWAERDKEKETEAEKLSRTVTESTWIGVCFCMQGHLAHKRGISEENIYTLTSKAAFLKETLIGGEDDSIHSCGSRRPESAH